ncbi:YncE family protein [Halorubrum vacuolatum]|uniref:DNA-binding beta-propeller fold protein YncE n=1 Tax=Halorubrum vacuolatum TaxID=63740 RepID=A0A238XYD6_HALVU|nr:cell surface protein [Halorubrum vacuolatum]SNR63720.1 hypothetical protein SAMN06264855_12522 [Halorubrum vacuolatum]
MKRTTRRRFIHTGGAVGAIGLAGCLGEEPDDEPEADDAEPPEETDDTDDTDDEPEEEPAEATYEIWAADQGTNTIYIYEPAGNPDAEFDLVDEIDTGAADGEVPHMVAYSSDYEYAAIACTAGARTLVYRTEDRELVANLETGPGSHFAGFTPDDGALIVDVIGESRIVRVDVDLDEEAFEIDEALDIDEDVDGLTEEEGAPICHSYDHQGRSIHTLGPGYGEAGLVIVDHDEFEIAQAFDGDELPTNCGTMPHPTEDKFYLTAGLPTPTDDDGEPIEGEEGVGDYYVLDTSGDEVEVIVESESTEGIDAHGFWFTSDAEELWVLNRETNDGVVVDPETDEVIEEIEAFGPDQADDPDESDAPDILWGSPDGEFMFVTLRGQNPVSGDPHAATGVTSGFGVLDVETRDIVEVVEPDPDDEDSDFHGIGVRPLAEFDAATSPPY